MSYQNTATADYTFNKLYIALQATHWYSTDFLQDRTLLYLYSRLALFNNRFTLSAEYGLHRFSAGGYVYTAPYYYFNTQFSYKNWQLYATLYDQGAGFSGEIKYLKGTGNYIGLQYQRKNYLFGALLSNTFVNAKSSTENISPIAPYAKDSPTAMPAAMR